MAAWALCEHCLRFWRDLLSLGGNQMMSFSRVVIGYICRLHCHVNTGFWKTDGGIGGEGPSGGGS